MKSNAWSTATPGSPAASARALEDTKDDIMTRKNGIVASAALVAGLILTACTTTDDEIIFHSNDRYRDNGFPFSEAVEADGWIYLSGTLGLDPATNKLAPGGMEAEARQIMENIKSSLERYGSSMDRIVKCTVMIDDMDQWPAFNTIYKSYFTDNYPARSAFGADGLALGAVAEVDCIAKR